jgi:ribosomal-protein-alanine N-acetyltransferase
VESILNKILRHWEQHGFGPWALIDKEGGQLIGWCGLRYLDDTDVEIAYGIVKAYWGKGLASEAARATIKYGFEQLGLPRIVAVASPDNIRSLRVLEKLGMKYVKAARFYNADVLYYAISREEYLAEGLEGRPIL